MKALFLVLLVIMLLGCVRPEAERLEQKASGFKFETVEKGIVARVIDGDTFVLENGERVRLIGIDTPEKGEPCFEEAKNRLQELVLGKDVLLHKDKSNRDKYGRLVRFAYVEGFFVNLALLEEGFAFAFEFGSDTSMSGIFRKAEEKAAERKGCLWKKEWIEPDFNKAKALLELHRFA